MTFLQGHCQSPSNGYKVGSVESPHILLSPTIAPRSSTKMLNQPSKSMTISRICHLPPLKHFDSRSKQTCKYQLSKVLQLLSSVSKPKTSLLGYIPSTTWHPHPSNPPQSYNFPIMLNREKEAVSCS